VCVCVCVCVCEKLKLSDAALRIEVSIDAVDLPSSPDTRVYACLQQHVTQLQVKWLRLVELHDFIVVIKTKRFFAELMTKSIIIYEGTRLFILLKCIISCYACLVGDLI